MQMEIAKCKHNFLALHIFFPHTKYHHHSSSPLSINFCFLFSAYIISCHIGNWTLTNMKKIKRKLLPKLLISRTLTFNISATECLIEIIFQFWILQTKAYNISHYKGNLNHWLSQPRLPLTCSTYYVTSARNVIKLKYAIHCIITLTSF